MSRHQLLQYVRKMMCLKLKPNLDLIALCVVLNFQKRSVIKRASYNCKSIIINIYRNLSVVLYTMCLRQQLLGMCSKVSQFKCTCFSKMLVEKHKNIVNMYCRYDIISFYMILIPCFYRLHLNTLFKLHKLLICVVYYFETFPVYFININVKNIYVLEKFKHRNLIEVILKSFLNSLPVFVINVSSGIFMLYLVNIPVYVTYLKNIHTYFILTVLYSYIMKHLVLLFTYEFQKWIIN